MKHPWFIAITVVLALSFAGCKESKAPAVNEPAATNESTVEVEPTAAPTQTPLPPNVRKDSDGNLIKSDGWPIQEIIRKETRRMTAAGKTKKGRTVIYNEVLITPEGRPVAQAVPPYSEDGVPKDFYEWRIRDVRELSGRDGKVFCYVYGATLFGRGNGNYNSAMATATSYHLCDYDGDGKYEFLGQLVTIAIPDWVKSVRGGPPAINSDANW